MKRTILSVVIPTAGRPQLLPRAITSALQSAPDGDVEVIVVPNGPDTSWKTVEEKFRADPRVLWYPITAGHANAARNHGMRVATGECIRFLDDDDYFYPEVCARQCELLLSEKADACSGAVDVIQDGGHLTEVRRQPDSRDFAASVLCPSRVTLICAHVFRREALNDFLWDEKRSIRQDTDWMMRVASSREMKWVCLEEPVGVWIQHGGVRVSKGRDPGAEVLRETADMINAAVARLEKDGRLSEARRIAAADALWSCLQKGLKYDPGYWRAIARIADGYAPGRTPPSRIYQYGLIRKLNPLLVEGVLVPLRWVYHPIRRILESFGYGKT